jgi:hypothetical protein
MPTSEMIGSDEETRTNIRSSEEIRTSDRRVLPVHAIHASSCLAADICNLLHEINGVKVDDKIVNTLM